MSEVSRQTWGCQASLCSRRIELCGIFCGRHWAALDPELRRSLSGIDPRGLLWDSNPRSFDDPIIVELCERIADAVESLAAAERNPVGNQWRRRADQVRDRIAKQGQSDRVKSAMDPVPVQGRLIEEHPDLNGAYGPDGRRQ